MMGWVICGSCITTVFLPIGGWCTLCIFPDGRSKRLLGTLLWEIIQQPKLALLPLMCLLQKYEVTMLNTIFVGQGVAKDCIVGDRLMNRYAIFNGLERPRRIDSNLSVTVLGFDPPVITSQTSVATAGNLVNLKWYAYRAVYASYKYIRPVANSDGSLNYTRGNGSVVSSAQCVHANGSMSVVLPGSTDAGVTHIFLYRSLGASTQAEAEAGPFYYSSQAANAAGNVTIVDGTLEASLGLVIEDDNYPPNAYRYAVASFGYIFAGGNFLLGPGYTCTVTPGSSTVTVNSPILYDGIRGWTFKCPNDSTGGVNGTGVYYANYLSPTTLTLVNASGVAMNYNGGLAGAGHQFAVYLPGNVLRWSKYGEPESWPLINIAELEGDITGIIEMPDLPYLLVCTDQPSVWMFDLTLVGTNSFKQNKRKISSEFSVSSHYSLCPVDGRVRGIDVPRKCIIETDGVSVRDMTKLIIPDIWKYLDNDEGHVKNWHCAYDQAQHIFGAFVGFHHSQRIVDFCIGQNTITGGWFFNLEKDLLCTGRYIDSTTGEQMILGGTQGLPSGLGALWGRIWCPEVWDEWVPSTSLRSGTVTAGTATSITVDVSGGTNLYTGPGALNGRWVLVTDANGEYAQLAYIQSNTVNSITIDSVMNGITTSQFSPVPVAGYKFYIGLIEMRWGPKRFDFSDPDLDKKTLEVQLVVSDYDTGNLPFIRVYRGFEGGYKYQRKLTQAVFLDKTPNQGLYHRYQTLVEPTARWGVSFVDRGYSQTALRSLAVVLHVVGEIPKNANK